MQAHIFRGVHSLTSNIMVSNSLVYAKADLVVHYNAGTHICEQAGSVQTSQSHPVSFYMPTAATLQLKASDIPTVGGYCGVSAPACSPRSERVSASAGVASRCAFPNSVGLAL